MNLQSTISLYAGGPGSGCNPEKGKCGRPMGAWHGQMQTQNFHQDKDGHYLPYRSAIHDTLIRKYENKPQQKDPVIKLIAGGAASGKTTAAKEEFKDLRNPAIVNMDMPRADLPEFKQVIGTNKTGLLQEEASDIRDKILMSALAHNNDIALDAVGSPGLAQKLDALEKTGYKVAVTYVHTPTEESIQRAAMRAKTATEPADKRVIPESDIRASHAKSRGALPLLMKPGREVKIYDTTGKKAGEPSDLIYHRGVDGTVDVKDDAKLEQMKNGEEPKIPDSTF